jgi:hypothetical protein
MISRLRIRRTGVAFVVMGIVLSTVDVNPAGEIPGAFADEVAAVSVPASPQAASSPAAAASPDAASSPQAVAASAVAPDTVQKAPEGGDLTHLTFEATDALSASLVAPADEDVAPSTAASIEVQTVKGGGVELKVGDAVVPFTRIGKRTVDTKTGVTRYTYYGIALQPGPNAVALTPLGANNLRGTTTVHRIFGPGRPATLSVSGIGPFRADGTSSDQIRIEARDAWGHHAASGSVVQLALVQGDARLERGAPAAAASAENPAAPHTPTPLSTSSPAAVSANTVRQTVDVALDANGAATVRLIPGLTPGALVLRAECGDAARDARFFLAPNLRKPFVTGLVSAGAGSVPGIPDAPDGQPDGTNSRRGRIALFGTGAMGKSLATFAYDTADTLQRSPQYGGALGTFSGDAADRPYAITGDASMRRDDALSRDHLFARLDSGRASAQWGEFRASTGSSTSALGGFDQLVAGAKVELAGDNRRLSAFVARNDVGYDRRVFAPTGLANGIVLRPSIVVGSEVVLLATLDARTGAVIAQSPLIRGADYSIEYATGQLHFIDVPLPLDEAFNPRQIVITYEFDAPGNAAKTVGGRAETSFGPNHAIKLGIGYVNDTTGAGNISLATQDIGGSFRGGSWQIAHATSRGSLLSTSPDAPLAGAGGSALHAQLTRASGPDRFTLLYDQTGTGYNDPFGGLATPGLLNERMTFAHKYAGGLGEIALDFGHQANTGLGLAGSTQTTASLRTRRALTKRFTLTASVERRIATSSASGPALGAATPVSLPAGFVPTPGTTLAYQPPAAQASTQAAVGVDWRATSALDVSVNRLQTLGGQNDVQPTQTDAQVTYDLGKGGRAYLRERWSAAPVQSFAAATQALTSATGGTHATEIGFARKLGNATSVDTSYLIDHGANGGDVYATMGVREKLSLGLTKGDAFFQHATAVGQNAGGFDLYGVMLSYADPANKFRATGSTQLRTGNGAGWSLTLAGVGSVSPDFSVFASINDASAAGSRQSDERVGVAWRPSRSDNGVTLLQYQRTDGNTGLSNTQSGVLSLEQVLRVRTRTELVGRYAYKLDGDSYYAARSSLAGLRLDQKIGSRLDVGAEARQAMVHGIDGANVTALAVEAGMRLGDNTRLGVGYNTRAVADQSLSATPARRGFYVTVTSVVDRLFGWGKR